MRYAYKARPSSGISCILDRVTRGSIRGVFRIPTGPEGATSVLIEERVLDDLLDGIDLEPGPSRRTRVLAH
jgi:hypothetical protein